MLHVLSDHSNLRMKSGMTSSNMHGPPLSSQFKQSDSSMNSIYARIQNLRQTLHMGSNGQNANTLSQDTSSALHVPVKGYSPMRVRTTNSHGSLVRSRSRSRGDKSPLSNPTKP